MMPGSSARNRSTCSAVVSRCRDTRTLPCDSTPIASSTWLGRSIEGVHDDPDEHREAAPVQRVQQRLAVDVQAGEGHQVRQPVDRVADDLHIGHRGRDCRPGPVHQQRRPADSGSSLGPRAARSAAAAATTSGHRTALVA